MSTHLILNSFGTALLRENGQFVVMKDQQRQSIPPESVESISISRGAKISADAALLAIEHEIDVMFIDTTGNPLGRLWSVKYGSVATIRKKQVEFTFSPQAVEWIKDTVMKKMDNQIALLMTIAPDEPHSRKLLLATVQRIGDYSKKVKTLRGQHVPEIAASLRGWEGAASKAYFQVIAELLPTEYRFAGRSQHPAFDVFNCLLNYGYGMLYGKVEGALIKAGIDPYVGIFHRDDYNRPVLAFDVIEMFRVWIDYVVVNLLMQKAIDEDCYSRRDDGSFWLESLGKRILIQSVNDYFDEVVTFNRLERSRATHIELYAQQLAQVFLKSKEPF